MGGHFLVQDHHAAWRLPTASVHGPPNGGKRRLAFKVMDVRPHQSGHCSYAINSRSGQSCFRRYTRELGALHDYLGRIIVLC